jgi:hypothetical protein
MAIDILGMQGLPTQAQTYQPRVIPRRRPTPTRTQNQFTGVNPFQTPFVPMEMPQAQMPMPTVMPQPRPQMPGGQRPPMGVPDFVKAMPQAKLVTPAQTPAASQGGLLGNLLADDLGSAKGRGIMSAAASLLESGGAVKGMPAPTLGQALGRAYNAGMGSFDAQKANEAALASQAITDQYKKAQAAQMEASASRPILQDLGNGAFTRVVDPVTGESKIIENTDVKNYLKEQAIKRQTKNINLSDKQIEAQTDELDNITATNDLLSDTDDFLDMMTPDPETGEVELEFGVFDSIGDETLGLNPFLSDSAKQEARNSRRFDTYIQRLSNELLRMAKGVQTDGDAKRAIKEIVDAKDRNDTVTVRQQMEKLREVQKRTIKRYQAKVQNRRKEKKLDPYDFGGGATADGVGYSIVEDDG